MSQESLEVGPGAHRWVRLRGDGGPVGVYYYWVCKTCGAEGGVSICDRPLFEDTPFWRTMAHPVSIDCNEAKEQIADYESKEACSWGDYEI